MPCNRKILIFDVDGVLLDSMDFWYHCGEKLFEHLKIAPSQEFNDRVTRYSVPQMAEVVCREFKLPYTPAQIVEIIIHLADDFYTNCAPMKEGVAWTLQALCAKDKYTMLVATAGETELVKAAFRRLGLLDYFTEILCCRELKFNKDSPELYRAIADKYAVPPGEMTVIEDSLYAIASAKTAGCHTIGVFDSPSASDWNKIQASADHAVKTLPDILSAGL